MSSRTTKRVLGALTVGCVTYGLVLSAMAPSSAAAVPAPRRVSTVDVERAQLPLVVAANDLMKLTREGAAAGMSGYAGVTISVADATVTLYWHGPLPGRLRSMVDDLRRRTTVVITSAPYSRQVLEARSRQLARSSHALAGRGLVLSRVGPRPDGTGVVLGVDGVLSAALHATTAVARLSPQAILQQVTPGAVPVAVVDAGTNTPTGERDYDNSPWWGGSRIVRPGDVDCSTAFSVANNSTSFMLTAGHCGGINTVWNPGDHFVSNGVRMGIEINRDSAHDTAVITVGANQPFIYDGGWSSTAPERVIGAESPVPGQSVCTEGATDGARCAITIMYTGLYVNFNNEFTASNEVWGVSNHEANAGGDSGGPVIANSGTPGSVYAIGTISGAQTPTIACANGDPGTPGGDPGMKAQPCYNNVYFEDINITLEHWLVHLV